jgi:hypothetical protein
MSDSEAAPIALQFANDLVGGRFDDAYASLSTSLRGQLSVDELQDTYRSMVSYFPSIPDLVEVMGEHLEWPTQEVSDLGWVYVSIASSKGYGEAVAVVVTLENNRAVIRDVEWGRP